MAEIRLGPVPQIGAPGIRAFPFRQGCATAGTTNVSQNAATQPLDAGVAPIDRDRVATIRKAIASDSYPLLPAKIGDAMIAAGILLRSATA